MRLSLPVETAYVGHSPCTEYDIHDYIAAYRRAGIGYLHPELQGSKELDKVEKQFGIRRVPCGRQAHAAIIRADNNRETSLGYSVADILNQLSKPEHAHKSEVAFAIQERLHTYFQQ